MSLLKTLRKLGGPLFAALLALAVVMPTIDVYACANDKAPTATTVSAAVSKVASQQQKSGAPIERHDDGDSGCIHGHCHHGIGMAKLSEVELASVTLPMGKVAPRTVETPPSGPAIDLLRPPRG
jgi:hypothetical protein